MRLIERTIGCETAWYDGDFIPQFLYGAETCELWDELNDPDTMPVAFPKTLAEARYIITQNGHTIV